MTFGSLFAGIGGFDLGFERAGMTCKWQVEINEFCRKVLAKHWPDVRRHDDVRTFPPTEPAEWRVDVICGGFPCQDISSSGHKVGIGGERSGLWGEYARVIRLVRPRFVVVENVADILHRGLGDVLGDLAGMGFDAEWRLFPAAAFGVAQRRPRVFIVADAHRWGRGGSQERHVFDADAQRGAYLDGLGVAERAAAVCAARVRRVGRGVPRGVDRLRVAGCGNAVVPQVAEWIGRRLMKVFDSEVV